MKPQPLINLSGGPQPSESRLPALFGLCRAELLLLCVLLFLVVRFLVVAGPGFSDGFLKECAWASCSHDERERRRGRKMGWP